ncbi:glycosyl transferase [Caulobacter sp. AP07]|uniref:glycosyltransferase family 2 protein n=1 Tax=Caulobacter sp. AP07 TaxID=1144304 RepID=UPI000271F265|nr:glycosyltransferase family 2 protein [Caulobacter sp. AP07]EJL34063.1 glycosyl transferase [Caulobacter sp. AP07]
MSAAQPVHVAVTVITYKRPDGLKRLLDALEAQERPEDLPFRLSVVVVDNDENEGGRGVAEAYLNSPRLDVRYFVERRRGIPVARNTALDNVPEDADAFCLVDDDEWPVLDWIASLLRKWDNGRVDCVYGPVEPVYPEDPPAWFIKSRVFERKRFADGAPIGHAASNNAMVSTAFIRRTGLRFDERMRFTGGSDYRFFKQGRKQGMTIIWSAASLVYDEVPANRLTWKWILQRQYRLGNTFAVDARLEGDRGQSLRLFAYGVARVGFGVVSLPMALLGPFHAMRAMIHILRGSGTVFGLVGHRHEEYAP